MKKRIVTLLMSIVLTAGLVACAGESSNDTSNNTKTEKKEESNTDGSKGELEKDTIRWNSGTSGFVLLTVAQEKGYFKDAGITIEDVPATANADAMTMLATGKVDVVSNAGTSNPLQQISAGVDISVFGGNMVTGAMPIIAKAGTKWNGVEDLIGKKFACNPSYFALTGAIMEAGYDKPLEAVDWVSYTDYNDAMAAVIKGEVDYALMGTGQCQAAKESKDVDIMCFQSDIMPNYSCCRLVAATDFVNSNPNTVKTILKVLIRAQEYYENNKEECLKMHAAKIGADEDYVAAYMLDEHYRVSVDPLKNSVERAWDILGKTGFLDEKASETEITDHINTKLYQEALKEATDTYGAENPEFYDKMKTFYTENNE